MTKVTGPLNKALEAASAAELITTSSGNRLTRAAIGTVHMLAAISMARRGQQALDRAAAKAGDLTVTDGLWQVANFAGVLLLTTVSTGWLSTGYYGQ